MGKIGHGYGSEWHLLRFLGYHRDTFSRQVRAEIGGEELSWLDFKFSHKNKACGRDTEYNGLDFITDQDVLRNWYAFWPTTGQAQNWDAVGRLRLADGTEEWLLVEAKAHTREIKGNGCSATSPRSIEKIEKALAETKAAFGASSTPLEDWMGPYYQYANRLAALYFLMEAYQPALPARLLFIYFLGDKHKNQDCPRTKDEWKPSIDKMESALGIDHGSPLFGRVHNLFLPVTPIVKLGNPFKR